MTNKKDKAQADARRKRAKRQLQAAGQRRHQFEDSYHPTALTPALYPLSLALQQIRNDQVANSAPPQQEHSLLDTGNTELDDFDFEPHHPPPTPPLEPRREDPENHGSLEEEGNGSEVPDDGLVEHANLSNSDIQSQVDDVARRLTDQLISFQGCCADCHARREEEHQGQFKQHVSLSQYLDSIANRCPDILGTTHIATQQDHLAGKVDAQTRRKIFSGLSDTDQPPHVCLEADERVSGSAGLHLNVDSIAGFPSGLAIAKEGVLWPPTQMPVSDLQSSLHLHPRAVSYVDDAGHLHQIHRPVHQIPHYTFGGLVAFMSPSTSCFPTCIERADSRVDFVMKIFGYGWTTSCFPSYPHITAALTFNTSLPVMITAATTHLPAVWSLVADKLTRCRGSSS